MISCTSGAKVKLTCLASPAYVCVVVETTTVQYIYIYFFATEVYSTEEYMYICICIYIYIYIYAYKDMIQVLPTDTVAQLVGRRRDMPKDLGSNPSESHIFYLFRCVLSFSATLAKRW